MSDDRLICCLFVAFLFASGPASAAIGEPAFYDGQRLYLDCGDMDVAAQARCTGYIMGIVDAIAASGDIHGYKACGLSAKATEKEIVDWVKRSLVERQELLASDASMLVASALSWKFACPAPTGVHPCGVCGPPG